MGTCQGTWPLESDRPRHAALPDGCVTVDKTTSEPEVAHLPTLTLSGVWGQIKGDNILLKETICKSVSASISSPSSDFIRLLLALRLHVIG